MGAAEINLPEVGERFKNYWESHSADTSPTGQMSQQPDSASMREPSNHPPGKHSLTLLIRRRSALNGFTSSECWKQSSECRSMAPVPGVSRVSTMGHVKVLWTLALIGSSSIAWEQALSLEAGPFCLDSAVIFEMSHGIECSSSRLRYGSSCN